MESAAFRAFDDVDRPSPGLIDDCVHCGFCLSACPTYLETGSELDSPRGRIYLMKSAGEGKIPLAGSLVTHLDKCLGCLACMPACPSGVQYGSLIEAGRSQIERRYERPLFQRLLRSLIFSLFPYPGRLRLMTPFFYLYEKLGVRRLVESSGILGAVSQNLAQMEEMLPKVNSLLPPPSLPEVVPAKGKRRYRVALLTGCVQSVFFARTNEATVRVLAENGCEVVIPRGQGCCGALSVHSGRLAEGRDFARGLIEKFEGLDADFLIINSAGCGSTIKEYGHILKDDPEYAARAGAVSAKARDVMEFLSEAGLAGELKNLNIKVTYQDACHLGHAQGIKEQPRSVIRQIPGIEFTELTESDVCCGSAGIYNLVQPEMSRKLLVRKTSHVEETKADYIVAGNPGCLLQIEKGIRQKGLKMKTAHPVELLDWSYRGGKD
ncbi:MAG: 4Fe-4S dicluster domain-containing protein [Candidatus Dadabacteria bacterium]|nr:4Fe-4S dicluster domain-containing protein [Candidatus Dadabacteria bacterium]